MWELWLLSAGLVMVSAVAFWEHRVVLGLCQDLDDDHDLQLEHKTQDDALFKAQREDTHRQDEELHIHATRLTAVEHHAEELNLDITEALTAVSSYRSRLDTALHQNDAHAHRWHHMKHEELHGDAAGTHLHTYECLDCGKQDVVERTS